jgi:hypothetical protein
MRKRNILCRCYRFPNRFSDHRSLVRQRLRRHCIMSHKIGLRLRRRHVDLHPRPKRTREMTRREPRLAKACI